MTRGRKRTSNMARWTAEDLQAALKAIKEGKPMTEASALYGIPRTTIYRRLKHNKFSSPKMGRNSVFTTEQEEILTNHIIKQQRTNPLNSQKFRRLAFDVAEKLQLDHNFSKEKQEAGQEWLSSFLRRNPRAQIIKRGERNRETKEELTIENPNSFDNFDEDPSTSETDNVANNEAIFFKMEDKFSEDSEILDFQSDPLEDTVTEFERKTDKCLRKLTKSRNSKTGNEVQRKLGMSLRPRRKALSDEESNTCQSDFEQKSKVVDKNTFLGQLTKSRRVVDRKNFLDQLEKSNRVVNADEDMGPAINKKRGKRTTKPACWTAEDLNATLQDLAEGKTMRAASALHGVPRTSIYRRLRMKNFSSPKLGRNSVFTPKQEECLTEYILKVSNVCPMNTTQLRRIAFELAEKMNLDHNFNREIRLAGKDWLMAFMKRNPRANFKGKRKLCETNNYQSENRVFFYDFEDLVKTFPSLECQTPDA